LPVTLDRRSDSWIVRLEGEIDIRCAFELKQALLDRLGSGTALRVDLSQSTQLDITAVQLLWAARYDAAQKGAVLTLSGPIPEEVCASMREIGFERLLPLPSSAVGQAGGPAIEGPTPCR
jgi:anti-anti-sigma regulatory factor